MIFSRSTEYALRALVQLASLPQDGYAMARTLAADAGIPAHFLAKILQDLARAGFLKSVKGPGGGFRMARTAAEISILSVARSIDGPARLDRCPLGLGECGAQLACGMHESWEPVRSRIMEYMGGTSIADMVESLLERQRLARQKPEKGNNKWTARSAKHEAVGHEEVKHEAVRKEVLREAAGKVKGPRH